MVKMFLLLLSMCLSFVYAGDTQKEPLLTADAGQCGDGELKEKQSKNQELLEKIVIGNVKTTMLGHILRVVKGTGGIPDSLLYRVQQGTIKSYDLIHRNSFMTSDYQELAAGTYVYEPHFITEKRKVVPQSCTAPSCYANFDLGALFIGTTDKQMVQELSVKAMLEELRKQ